jgi:hypothetical protein
LAETPPLAKPSTASVGSTQRINDFPLQYHYLPGGLKSLTKTKKQSTSTVSTGMGPN